MKSYIPVFRTKVKLILMNCTTLQAVGYSVIIKPDDRSMIDMLSHLLGVGGSDSLNTRGSRGQKAYDFVSQHTVLLNR